MSPTSNQMPWDRYRLYDRGIERKEGEKRKVTSLEEKWYKEEGKGTDQ